jgi:hypothetical protein
MTTRIFPPSASPSVPDLADWLDVRLMLAGRLTLANIPLRHDRADLATVLGDAQQPRSGRLSDGRPEINVR